jgi:hypothetical protein
MSSLARSTSASLLVALIFAFAPAVAMSATYTCTKSGSPGAGPRSVTVQIDEAAETVTAPTKRGTARGVLQKTMDLYISRIETIDGAAYVFSLHRPTGRAKVQVEQSIDKADRVAEFSGYCVLK